MLIKEFSQTLLALEQNSSRLKIRSILQNLFNNIYQKHEQDRSKHTRSNLQAADYFIVSYFLTGNIVPDFIPIEFGLQEKTILNIIVDMFPYKHVKELMNQVGDIGDLWFEIASELDLSTKNKELLTVYNNLLELALVSGSGSIAKKKEFLQSILMSVDALSGKYIIRLILGKLRLGVNTKSVLDAIADHFLERIQKNIRSSSLRGVFKRLGYVDSVSIKQVKDFLRYFYGVTNDIGLVSFAIYEMPLQELFNITALPAVPISSQLAEREKNIKHVFARIPSPILEPKYDGLRGQLHVLSPTSFKKTEARTNLLNIENRVWFKAYQQVIKKESSNLKLLTLNQGLKGSFDEFLIFSRNSSDLSRMFPEVEHDVRLIRKYLKRKNTQWLVELLMTHYKAILEKKAVFEAELNRLLKNTKNFGITKTALIYEKKKFFEGVMNYLDYLKTQPFIPGLILDSEIIGFDENTGEFIPFQQTITRRRKYDIQDTAQIIPVRFYVFDLMFLGLDLVKLPFALRRFLLETLFDDIKEFNVLTLTPEHTIPFMKVQEAENLFDLYIEAGLEGVMFKDPLAQYAPGVRNFAWIKYKRAMKGELADTLDVVVLGYYYGKGKRAELGIGALLIGVYDSQRNRFVTVSKLGTGLTDVQWKHIKSVLNKNKVNKKPVNVTVPKELVPDVWIYPSTVIVVEADEITKSPLHTAGYALRFPRFKEIRIDKAADQATTLLELEEMYNLSKNKE